MVHAGSSLISGPATCPEGFASSIATRGFPSLLWLQPQQDGGLPPLDAVENIIPEYQYIFADQPRKPGGGPRAAGGASGTSGAGAECVHLIRHKLKSSLLFFCCCETRLGSGQMALSNPESFHISDSSLSADMVVSGGSHSVIQEVIVSFISYCAVTRLPWLQRWNSRRRSCSSGRPRSSRGTARPSRSWGRRSSPSGSRSGNSRSVSSVVDTRKPLRSKHARRFHWSDARSRMWKKGSWS